jgi:murein DD-endopeptidase MepM/ murein hydrolase activator NlpD
MEDTARAWRVPGAAHKRIHLVLRPIHPPAQGVLVRKKYYIIFVAREEDGRLRKIPIPLHYAYIFVAAALVGAFTITGMAGSYSRMLLKTASFNQVRSQRETLRKDYAQLEQVAHQKDVQAASLGSLAGQVSALYGLGLHSTHAAKLSAAAAASAPLADTPGVFSQQAYAKSLDQFTELRASALAGHLEPGLSFGRHSFGDSASFSGALSDSMNPADAPSLWPVIGRVTSSFGEREDPFNGEGAFHAGIDIATGYGNPVHAPADGYILMAGPASGYGREMILDHGQGITTVYGHLSGFAVAAGQQVKRGQVIGYVGSAGRSTGPHLHYEVRIRNTPVNPHKYLRETMEQQVAAGTTAPGPGL